MSVEVAARREEFKPRIKTWARRAMNDKGDDRRLALEQGVGAAAPDDEVARALKADHAAGFEPLDFFRLG